MARRAPTYTRRCHNGRRRKHALALVRVQRFEPTIRHKSGFRGGYVTELREVYR